MTRLLGAIALVAVPAVHGCSPVTRYYTLSPVDGASLAGERREASALVGVGPVELPDYVDRPQIVVRSGSNAVLQATFDQWGGSLDDMVPAVLVDNLATRLPGDHFVAFPQSGDLAFDYRVPIVISRFDVSTAGEAVVTARWQVRGRLGSDLVLVRETTARATADGSSYDQRVAALSKALGSLSDEIAKVLAPLTRGTQGKKPAKK